MALTHADVTRIFELLDRAVDLDTLEVKLGDFVVQASKSGIVASGGAALLQSGGATPPTPTPAPTQAVSSAAVVVPEGMIAVLAPMVGTFYSRPRPDEPLFVEEGQVVEEGATVCLVEVMKMFNSVTACARGTVHKIFVRNGELVQHDQVLMLIAPLAV
jgi:acetyl-CoA carboxylase biotin carboxyl carrier protein